MFSFLEIFRQFLLGLCIGISLQIITLAIKGNLIGIIKIRTSSFLFVTYFIALFLWIGLFINEPYFFPLGLVGWLTLLFSVLSVAIVAHFVLVKSLKNYYAAMSIMWPMVVYFKSKPQGSAKTLNHEFKKFLTDVHNLNSTHEAFTMEKDAYVNGGEEMIDGMYFVENDTYYLNLAMHKDLIKFLRRFRKQLSYVAIPYKFKISTESTTQ